MDKTDQERIMKLARESEAFAHGLGDAVRWND